eukprot:2055029-Pyramimonas_sp.AAC.1
MPGAGLPATTPRSTARATTVMCWIDTGFTGAYCFPRKGEDSKNKDKHNRPAPFAGRGKGFRSRSPYWAADQTGGSSSSYPRPPSPPSGRYL